MDQPNRTAAESDAIRASHSAFINQLLKSPISASPPASLPMYDSSNGIEAKDCKLSSRMFQNLFNHVDFLNLSRENDYDIYWIHWGLTPIPVWGEGVVSIVLRCVARHHQVIFDVHGFLTPSCEIKGASGMLEPKAVYLQRTYKLMSAKE